MTYGKSERDSTSYLSSFAITVFLILSCLLCLQIEGSRRMYGGDSPASILLSFSQLPLRFNYLSFFLFLYLFCVVCACASRSHRDFDLMQQNEDPCIRHEISFQNAAYEIIKDLMKSVCTFLLHKQGKNEGNFIKFLEVKKSFQMI